MDGEVVIGINMDTKGFDIQIATVEEELEGLIEEYKLLKELKPFEGQQKGLQELQKKIEQARNKLVDLKKKQQDLDNAGLSKIPASLNGIGNGIESVIKKVTRWGLAVFGIRSAYNFVRGSISTLSQYNEKMATDIEYIRFALATTLQPVIEKIIQLVYTLLQYIGYIAKAWFGVNLFANASTKAFKRTNKEAKKLQKTLAGFDEMNVLADNSDGDSGGGAAPSMDLSNIKEPDFSKIGGWLQKIRGMFSKTFDDILDNITKVMRDLGFGEDFIEMFRFTVEGIKKILGGIIDFIVGILKTIVGLVTGNTELVKEGIKQSINGIGNIIKGIIQVVTGVVGMIATIITSILKSIINSIKNAINNIKSFFTSIPSFFSNIVNTIFNFFRNLGSAAGNVIASAFKSVVNGVLRTIENILNSPIRTINSLISTINRISPVKIGRLSTFSLPRLAKGGIVNMPSRGVPIGGAIAGERGQEGVIPLTDSQQMALLGEAIGRYITINANITNTMNGRVISREIQRVQNNSNFAMNR